MGGISLNKLALKVVDEIIGKEDALRIGVHRSNGGATLIDFGIGAEGGYEAGLYVARVCLADLANITLRHNDYGGTVFPVIDQFIEHPVLACMASQYAGWKVSHGDFFAMGSGPARALARKPKKLYREIGHEEVSDEAVLVLETSRFPGEDVLRMVADTCGVSVKDLYVLLVPTNSLAGSIQISCRIAETGIHRLHTLHFPLEAIVSAAGMCPIAPLHPDPTLMMGRTNDALIYAGETFYAVKFEDEDRMKELVDRAPSYKSSSYGKPFYEIFKEAGFDFYKIDPGLFAPAKITVNNLLTGNSFTSGKTNIEVLLRSWR